MKWPGILLALSCVLCASVSNGEDIDSGSQQQSTGSTRSKGSYRIFEEGGKVKIKIDFCVRKSGVSGTGKGVMGFEIMNSDGKSLVKRDKGFTVGADAISGVAEKCDSQTITLFGNAAAELKNNGGAVAFTVRTEKDTIGIPTTPDEWKDTLGDAVPAILGSLGVGDSKDVGGWIIKRIIR